MKRTLSVKFVGGVNVYMDDSYVKDDMELKILAKSFLKDKFKEYFSDVNIGVAKEFVVTSVELKETPIMNTTNSHDSYLVECINESWYNKSTREMMKKVINLLMVRDKEECEEKGVRSSDYHDYLMHIADDRDLETILNFC